MAKFGLGEESLVNFLSKIIGGQTANRFIQNLKSLINPGSFQILIPQNDLPKPSVQNLELVPSREPFEMLVVEKVK